MGIYCFQTAVSPADLFFVLVPKIQPKFRCRPRPTHLHRNLSPRAILLEERLAAIWAEVLGLERVGVEDNFFALGGHSLLATQVISRAQDAFRKNLPVRRLFENPTISGLARLIENLSEPQIADGVQAPVLPVIRRLNRAGGAGL